MSDESTRYKLGKARLPRIRTTYDVEAGTAVEKMGPPCIAGPMTELSGEPAERPSPVRDRKFVETGRDDFRNALASSGPLTALHEPAPLVPAGSGIPNLEPRFDRTDDFTLAEASKQVPLLERLSELRSNLGDLLCRLDRDHALDAALGQMVQSTGEQAALKARLADPLAPGDVPPTEAA